MAVWTAEDRTLSVRPDQVVRTAWIDIDLCTLGNRTPMSPEAVGVSHQKLLCMGDDGRWPPPIGEWQDGRFVVLDGRHELLASLMRGRERMFVAWLETVDPLKEALADDPIEYGRQLAARMSVEAWEGAARDARQAKAD